MLDYKTKKHTWGSLAQICLSQRNAAQKETIMDINQNSGLDEWIAMGKQSGKIREVRTVVLAYCKDERTVLPLIVNVVKGCMTEENALAFMEQVLHFGTEGSDEILRLS
jgi:hypothetical protein